MSIRKTAIVVAATIATAFCFTGVANAHVVVTPDQAKVGQRVLFNVSVPNERDSAVSEIKLAVPSGVEDVMPTTKPGWSIDVNKASGTTEVRWSGGSIPSGQRDDFTLKAQVPAKAGNLDWKAYQTYADGVSVAWDQPPTGGHGDSNEGTNKGPFSVTKIVDDTKTTSNTNEQTTAKPSSLPTIISLAALVFAIAAFTRRPATAPTKPKKK